MSRRRTNTVASRIAGPVVAGLLVMVSALVFSADAEAFEPPWGTGDSQPQDLVISLATFGPGDEVAQWFGHSALIVEDRRHNEARMYNYGMFTFDETLLVRFAMGRLDFWVADTPMPESLHPYVNADRDTRLIELNLDGPRRLQVAEFLAENVRPQNRYYQYHHYDDNCATRIRDVIDMAVDGQFSDAYEDELGQWSLRGHTRRHTAHMPPMDWLLMFLMNDSIDRNTSVWDEMFLPLELERRVAEFEWVDDDGEAQPLSLREHVLHDSETRDSPPEQPPTHWHWWLLVGIGIGLVGLVVGWTSRRRPGRGSRLRYGLYQLFVGVMAGAPGLALGFMATFTEHDVTYWNQNLFWANPLTVLVVVLAVLVLRGSHRARRGLVQVWTFLAGVAAVGMVVQLVGIWVPGFYQDTSIPMALLVPTVIGAAGAAWIVDGRKLREDKEK